MHTGLFISALFCAVLLASAQGPSCSGPHESVMCLGDCPERTCQNRNEEYYCAPSESCIYRCECDNEYFRNSLGECLDRVECEYYP